MDERWEIAHGHASSKDVDQKVAGEFKPFLIAAETRTNKNSAAHAGNGSCKLLVKMDGTPLCNIVTSVNQ